MTEVNEGSGLAESVILEVHDKDTGALKQRKTIRDGKETDEFFPKEV
jgi:hypothetical protein